MLGWPHELEERVARHERRLELLEGIFIVNRMRGVQRVATALRFTEYSEDWSELAASAERALDWFGILYQSETLLPQKLIATTLAHVYPPTPKHKAKPDAAVQPYGVLVICWTAADRKQFLTLLEDFAMQWAIHAIVVVTQKKKIAPLPKVLRGKPVETVVISKKGTR